MLAAVLDRALRAVGVGRGQCGPHVLQSDAVFEQRLRVQFHANRRLCRTADQHLADTSDLRQTLAHHVARGIVDLPARQGIGRQCQDQHRCIGRIDLAVCRVAAQAGRQIGARRIDRRLHVARGTVDVAAEAELQHDARGADRTAGGHFGNVGDRSQMPFQRRGNRGRHGVRAGAGKLRLHQDCREINLRQRRDRQSEIGKEPSQRDADGQQRRGNRTRNERGGNIQSATPPSASRPRGRVPVGRPRRRSLSRSNIR